MDILRVEGLTKSFNKKEVLSDLSFSVKKGEIFGLVGRSGSEKSVLIKTLIGFYKPKRGKVFFEAEGKNPIGFSMQENSLYENLTMMQNLHFFSKIYNVEKKRSRQNN